MSLFTPPTRDPFEPARAILRNPRSTFGEAQAAINDLSASGEPSDIRAVSMFRNLGWSTASSDIDADEARAALDGMNYRAPVPVIDAIPPAPVAEGPFDCLFCLGFKLIIIGILLATALFLVLLIGEAVMRLGPILSDLVATAEARSAY